MPPSKRKSDPKAEPKSKAAKAEPKSKKAAQDLQAEVEAELKKHGATPCHYYKVVLARLDEILQQHAGLAGYLAGKYAGAEVAVLAEKVDSKFPPEPGVLYTNSAGLEADGPVTLRPWQLSYHAENGQKGFQQDENTRALTSLILLRGFQTDGTTLIGVEKLSVTRIVEIPGQHHPTGLSTSGMIGEVGYIKGWSRSCCLLFILDMLAGDDDLRSAVPTPVLDSFRTVHAIVKNYVSVEQRLEAARDITLASTSTRMRPNVFVYLFQVRKLSAAMNLTPDEAVARWQVNAVTSVLQISPEEAKASLNLANHIPACIVERLQGLARKYGLPRGPVNQGILASSLLVLGHGAPHNVEAVLVGVRNTPESLDLLLDRVTLFYENAPVQLRRTPNVAEFTLHQTLTTFFVYNMTLLKQQIGESYYEEACPKLRQKFLDGYLDFDMDTEFRRGTAVDLKRVDAFRVIVDAFESKEEASIRRHHQELSDRVAQATREQLLAALRMDQQAGFC